MAVAALSTATISENRKAVIAGTIIIQKPEKAT